ncbi:hypothetical protein [Rhodococcus sp. AW25M09]|uniref:hypothetical protein n=1 Tax=Rhodococcus sp. AW25M09 TaxID=1268303 RepID=UPI0003489BE6|nr:hypothetical protein [Rhodococcus sp. AW25M09]
MTRLQVGEEVLGAAGLRQAGAFAEFVIAEDRSVAHMPDGPTFAQTATLSVVGPTADQAVVEAGKLKSGQSISSMAVSVASAELPCSSQPACAHP